jgi:hypothetical protein
MNNDKTTAIKFLKDNSDIKVNFDECTFDADPYSEGVCRITFPEHVEGVWNAAVIYLSDDDFELIADERSFKDVDVLSEGKVAGKLNATGTGKITFTFPDGVECVGEVCCDGLFWGRDASDTFSDKADDYLEDDINAAYRNNR